MNTQGSFGSNLLFQSINNDLNASLATADELSREFSSLLSEAAPVGQTPTAQNFSPKSQNNNNINDSLYSPNKNGKDSFKSSLSQSPSRSFMSDPLNNRKESSSPLPNLDNMKYKPSLGLLAQQQSPLATRKDNSDPWHSLDQMSTPNSPGTLRTTQMPLRPHDRSPRGSRENSPLTSPNYDNKLFRNIVQPSSSPLSSIPRSPRLDRASPPLSFSQAAASTLPRNFQPFRPLEEGIQRPKNTPKWNETDLDASYERKPHHTYDKNEWIRQSVPNSGWKESNLDAPPSTSKETVPRPHPSSHSPHPRNTRISVPPDPSPSSSSPYAPQPIISRISIPPANSGARMHRPIPLSVIMRLQNPNYASTDSSYALSPILEPQQGMMRHPLPLPQEYLGQNQTLQQPQKQPPYYKEALHPGDIEAELEKLDANKPEGLVSITNPGMRVEEPVKVEDCELPPRPLSPTRLQPVVAPQTELNTDLDELMRIRAEFPRALKRRGSVDITQPLLLPVSQTNYYKQMINKMFRRRTSRFKEEATTESGSSSDGEEPPRPAGSINPIPITETASSEHRGIHSILRKGSKSTKAIKSSSRRAHLSPLVLMLDGSLVGELETVQRAAQKMSDPSQANDEGITALHNAICGGHFPVVEFLVRIGANVSAPDSHGWTPLHCAASCNDRRMCEFLVRNGAAVMAVTDSDGATAAQKCDPYAPGFEECEVFLRGVEEAMGVENSGVVYALWGYPAQAPDELSFREGDMVTILQKPEGEGFFQKCGPSHSAEHVHHPNGRFTCA
ncbi:hypothetical protein DNTS_013804 [Danionella cerebrum]|uniref:SH3 domain-containing protein n=1 Tax=Danionella cerebrum TaxID=2873325 RepID=A0A553RPE6_9TELE|nr:hypothetical protein DNTS_013804 [Danionella translucida]